MKERLKKFGNFAWFCLLFLSLTQSLYGAGYLAFSNFCYPPHHLVCQKRMGFWRARHYRKTIRFPWKLWGGFLGKSLEISMVAFGRWVRLSIYYLVSHTLDVEWVHLDPFSSRQHTLAFVPSSGLIYAFGCGAKGQLGTGRTCNVQCPSPVKGHWAAHNRQLSASTGKNDFQENKIIISISTPDGR